MHQAGSRPLGRGAGLYAAFTLIEVLLVCAILAVASAVTIPSFVRSIRGNRLRAAARSIVKAGRYARSMAVLEQRDMVLTFEVGGTGFHINRVRRPGAPGAGEGVGSDGEEEVADDSETGAEAGPDADAVRLGAELIERELDRVKIESVSFDVWGADSDLEGDRVAEVVYVRNGMCTPYRVRLVDQDGEVIVITVDALGSASSEREQ